MKNYRKLVPVAGLAAVLSLSGCWDSNDNEPTVPPAVATEVPDSAGISVASFVTYLLSLATDDESSEPLIIKDTFAVPADESSEPTPLI